MIILYNPRNSASRKPHLPMSLLALGALLEGKQDYQIVDGNLLGDPFSELAGMIGRTGADILGMTVMPGPQLQEAVPLARHVKRRFPDLTVVWGGYFPTLHHEAVVRADFVDFALRGHAERGFAKLVRALRKGDVDFDIRGLAWRDPAGGKIHANPLPAVPNPDKLPDFPYHRIDMAPYVHPTFMGERTISHHSSNGCPFRCNFCGVVNMANGRWKAQSAERTAAVTAHLVTRYGADAIEFHDSNFFVHEARGAEYAERIKPLGIGWWGLGRVDTMLKFSDGTWQKLRDSGLRMVFIGAESGSDETLKAMNKGGKQTADAALELAARMGSYSIVPEYSFVLGNPPEPEADVENTIRYIRRIKQVNPATEIILYLYSPVPPANEAATPPAAADRPGTLACMRDSPPDAMMDAAEATGFAFPETLDEWTSARWHDFAHHTTEELPWLSETVRRKVRDFEKVLHAAYPTVTDSRLSRPGRAILKAASALRYATESYANPLELRALGRLFPQRRPEVTGF